MKWDKNEDLSTFYWCRRHKSVTKAFLCCIQYFDVVDVTCNSTIHRRHCRICIATVSTGTCHSGTFCAGCLSCCNLKHCCRYWVSNSQLTIQILRMFYGQRAIYLRTKLYLLDETVNELSIQTNNLDKCPRGYHVVLRSTKVAYFLNKILYFSRVAWHNSV
jgi:hypothetical protein